MLLREPPSAFWSRFGYRLVLTGVLAVAAVLMPYVWLAVPIWILAGLMAVLALLAIVNIVRNKRALLVHQGSGSIEWPRSVQEIVLRRPVAWVAGSEIAVVQPPVTSLPGSADPRITLSDGERSIVNVPLYGVAPQAFVDAANAVLVGRGTVLRLEAPSDATSDATSEPPDGTHPGSPEAGE